MLIAHKIRLNPNKVQASYFARAAGTARFAYNWALAEWGKQYEAWKLDNTQPKPSQMSLRRALNALKREQFPWIMEVEQVRARRSYHAARDCVSKLFSGRARYPKFRKKGEHERFSISVYTHPPFRLGAHVVTLCGQNHVSHRFPGGR